jgi:hypothetical protein
MKRILLVLAVALVMAAMVVATAVPAFAASARNNACHPSDPSACINSTGPGTTAVDVFQAGPAQGLAPPKGLPSGEGNGWRGPGC